MTTKNDNDSRMSGHPENKWVHLFVSLVFWIVFSILIELIVRFWPGTAAVINHYLKVIGLSLAFLLPELFIHLLSHHAIDTVSILASSLITIAVRWRNLLPLLHRNRWLIMLIASLLLLVGLATWEFKVKPLRDKQKHDMEVKNENARQSAAKADALKHEIENLLAVNDLNDLKTAGVKIDELKNYIGSSGVDDLLKQYIRQIGSKAKTIYDKLLRMNLDRGQGIGEKLEALENEFNKASMDWEARDMVSARSSFEEVLKRVRELEVLDAQRKVALSDQSRANSARLVGEGTNSPLYAAKIWGTAKEHYKNGEWAMNDGRFVDAGNQFVLAEQQYTQATVLAVAVQRCRNAQNEYAKLSEDTNSVELMEVYGGQDWVDIKVMLQVAQTNAATNPLEAATNYEAAMKIWPEVLKRAQELKELNDQRNEALAARAQAKTARQAGVESHADTDVAEIWSQAEEKRQRGESLVNDGKFTEAGNQFREAELLYGKAVELQKERYVLQYKRLVEDSSSVKLMEAYGGQDWTNIQAGVKMAETNVIPLEAAKQYEAAIKAWPEMLKAAQKRAKEAESAGTMTARQKDAVIAMLMVYTNLGLYVTPDIPPKKLANARKSCAIASGDEPIALLDTTIFGSAKDCLVVTTRGIYFREIGSSGNFISISNFKVASLAKDSDSWWSGGDGVSIGNAHYDPVGSIPKDALLYLLQSIQYVLRKEADTPSQK